MGPSRTVTDQGGDLWTFKGVRNLVDDNDELARRVNEVLRPTLLAALQTLCETYHLDPTSIQRAEVTSHAIILWDRSDIPTYYPVTQQVPLTPSAAHRLQEEVPLARIPLDDRDVSMMPLATRVIGDPPVFQTIQNILQAVAFAFQAIQIDFSIPAPLSSRTPALEERKSTSLPHSGPKLSPSPLVTPLPVFEALPSSTAFPVVEPPPPFIPLSSSVPLSSESTLPSDTLSSSVPPPAPPSSVPSPLSSDALSSTVPLTTRRVRPAGDIEYEEEELKSEATKVQEDLLKQAAEAEEPFAFAGQEASHRSPEEVLKESSLLLAHLNTLARYFETSEGQSVDPTLHLGVLGDLYRKKRAAEEKITPHEVRQDQLRQEGVDLRDPAWVEAQAALDKARETAALFSEAYDRALLTLQPSMPWLRAINYAWSRLSVEDRAVQISSNTPAGILLQRYFQLSIFCSDPIIGEARGFANRSSPDTLPGFRDTFPFLEVDSKRSAPTQREQLSISMQLQLPPPCQDPQEQLRKDWTRCLTVLQVEGAWNAFQVGDLPIGADLYGFLLEKLGFPRGTIPGELPLEVRQFLELFHQGSIAPIASLVRAYAGEINLSFLDSEIGFFRPSAPDGEPLVLLQATSDIGLYTRPLCERLPLPLLQEGVSQLDRSIFSVKYTSKVANIQEKVTDPSILLDQDQVKEDLQQVFQEAGKDPHIPPRARNFYVCVSEAFTGKEISDAVANINFSLPFGGLTASLLKIALFALQTIPDKNMLEQLIKECSSLSLDRDSLSLQEKAALKATLSALQINAKNALSLIAFDIALGFLDPNPQPPLADQITVFKDLTPEQASRSISLLDNRPSLSIALTEIGKALQESLEPLPLAGSPDFFKTQGVPFTAVHFDRLSEEGAVGRVEWFIPQIVSSSQQKCEGLIGAGAQVDFRLQNNGTNWEYIPSLPKPVEIVLLTPSPPP